MCLTKKIQRGVTLLNIGAHFPFHKEKAPCMLLVSWYVAYFVLGRFCVASQQLLHDLPNVLLGPRVAIQVG